VAIRVVLAQTRGIAARGPALEVADERRLQPVTQIRSPRERAGLLLTA